MEKIKTPPNIKSQITLEGDIIQFTSGVSDDWTIRIPDVKLLGEATNQNGPCSDDYFICFATSSSSWEEVSFYSEGRDSFLASLGKRLGAELNLELAHSTDFSSRILWPLKLRGEPMFTFTDFVPKNFIGWIFGSRRYRQTFFEEALSVLQA